MAAELEKGGHIVAASQEAEVEVADAQTTLSGSHRQLGWTFPSQLT